MESFIIKEVKKRPIIYDKAVRAVENCKEIEKAAFQDISREIHEVMNVQVPGKICLITLWIENCNIRVS